MVQGDLAGVTLTHLGVASQTGLLGVFPILGVTYTRYAWHLTNRWAASALLGSLVISYTRLGKKIDRLAEPFAAGQPISEPIPNP